MTVDDYDTKYGGGINSFYVLGSADSNFSNPIRVAQTLSVGEITFNEDDFLECNYFKIVADCQAGSTNNFVQISKIASCGESDSPSLKITNVPSGNLEADSTGKFGYKAKRATVTEVAWPSSNEDVL